MNKMGSPWDCICEWVRSQSAVMSEVVSGLANADSFSDIGTGDTLTTDAAVSPIHMFLMGLLMIWGFLYVYGRNRGAMDEKPANPHSGDTGDNPGNDGPGPDGPGNNELF